MNVNDDGKAWRKCSKRGVVCVKVAGLEARARLRGLGPHAVWKLTNAD